MKAQFWLVAVAAILSIAFGLGTGAAQFPPAPIPDFTASPRSGVAPLQVNFTDLSTNAPAEWLWSFGDGNTSTVQNPTNLYAKAGVYTVTLTVRNAGGANVTTKASFITVLTAPPPPPVTQFAATPVRGPAPLTVRFTDQTLNFPTTWVWNFGDETTSTERNPTHVYPVAGTFTVTLTTFNGTGTNTLTRRDLIVVTGGPPPVANFTAAPTEGIAPLTVQFTDRSAGSPTAWFWGFGDGSPVETAQNPEHTYTRVGRFSVTLTVSSSGGSSAKTQPGLILVTFPDVPIGFWALPEILAVVDAGIAQGFPDGRFHPEMQVTRDQAAVFIARGVAGGDANVPSGPATPTFSDVPTTYWAFRWIEFVNARGIILGFPDGTFRPTQVTTRADVTTFMARVVAGGDANVPPFTGTPTFPDVPADSPSLKYIEFAHARGLVQGFPDGLFHPDMAVTRDQMSVFLARTFHLPT